VTTTAKSTKASAAAAGYYYAAVALMLHGVVETEWTLQMTNAFESMLERALTNLGYDINSISLAGIAVVSHEPVDSVEVVARVEVRGTFEDVEAMKTTVMASVDKNNFSSLTQLMALSLVISTESPLCQCSWHRPKPKKPNRYRHQQAAVERYRLLSG